MVQWLRICLPVQGTQIQSLVGELRSHMVPLRPDAAISINKYFLKRKKEEFTNKFSFGKIERYSAGSSGDLHCPTSKMCP